MTDPLAALRQLVDGMSPDEWIGDMTEDQLAAGVRALRLLADEATVEGVAGVIVDNSGHLLPGYLVDDIARAVIAHLAAQIVKE